MVIWMKKKATLFLPSVELEGGRGMVRMRLTSRHLEHIQTNVAADS